MSRVRIPSLAPFFRIFIEFSKNVGYSEGTLKSKHKRQDVMNPPPSSLNWALAVAAVVVVFCDTTHASPQVLKDSIPRVISHLSAVGRLDPQTQLNLSIGLPLQSESTLDNLLGQLSDPASPNYRRYLTPQQFNQQFAPSASDYQAVANFFGTNGFTVVQHSSRMVLDVSGSAADVERVFHVTMRTWQHPTQHRTFFAPDSVPSFDLTVPILHISGLDNYAVKSSKIRKMSSSKRAANRAAHATSRQFGSGSGPEGAYLGNDFRAAYIPGVSLTGTGQTVGLLEYDGYYAGDISAYESLAGVSVPQTIVNVDGGPGTPGGGNDEVALDIDVAMSIAPGLTQIVVYEAPATASWEDLLDAMANDTVNSPKQFSCSWGDSSPDVPNPTAEDIFKQMDTQGQTFYDASGDGDAFVGGIPFPAESTNIVQVGGTTVNTTGPGGAWVSETTWDWGGSGLADNSVGVSGGVSENYSIPSWQTNINMAANEGSTTMRNVPDVAMTADNVYIQADDGQTQEPVGGTSCAAPAWAAFTALANEQAAANSKPSVGFAAPAIYAAGVSASYLSDFNDTTTGNNFWAFSINLFPAVPGYDLCTGWGTPDGDNLIDMLAGVADPLQVSPGKGFVAFGPTSGAFSASTQTFSLTNSSASSLNWSLVNTSSWLTASSSGGALASHSGTHVMVSLNAAANSLPAGTYTAGVLFSNQTSHALRMREFVLVAGQNLVVNGGFEEYPAALPNWAQTGGVGMYNEIPYPTANFDFVDDGTLTSFAPTAPTPHSGTNFCVLGTPGTYGYISQNIPTVPGQSYTLSFWLMNTPDGTPTERFLVNWNANSGPANTVYSFSDTTGFDWSNVVVSLTAASTNTILQFGARSDQSADTLNNSLLGWGNFFVLDDVTLMPIGSLSAATINASISRASPGTFVLTWNSVSGTVYHVQYSATLLSANWVNVSTNTAAGSTLSVTNTVAGPLGFYRIVVP
jgi:hypothetical protein